MILKTWNQGQNVPEKLEKSAVQISIAGIADRMVRAEMNAGGSKRVDAEKAIAKRAGLSQSALENLRRGRIKNVEAIAGRIKAVWEAELERQIAGLEHDLMVARALGRGADLGTAEAAIAQARAALGK